MMQSFSLRSIAIVGALLSVVLFSNSPSTVSAAPVIGDLNFTRIVGLSVNDPAPLSKAEKQDQVALQKRSPNEINDKFNNIKENVGNSINKFENKAGAAFNSVKNEASEFGKKAPGVMRKTINEHSGAIGAATGTVVGTGVTAAIGPAMGPFGPVVGGATGKVVGDHVAKVAKKCTEDNATKKCLLG
ncbi:hypothetical protein BDF19DRAFT_450706 [Syncephalis fuscata]|nr:hypothetical protein BDF19DRAFT_450706 [Syncephalis fuscata]